MGYLCERIRRLRAHSRPQSEVQYLVLGAESGNSLRLRIIRELPSDQTFVDKAANWRGLVKPSSLRVPLNETIMRRLTGVASDKGFQFTRTTIQVIVADALSQAINASNGGLFSWARGQTR